MIQILIIILFSLVYCEEISNTATQNTNVIISNSKIEDINSKYKSILGRDNDPKKITDLSKRQLFFRKLGWTSTVTHFKVNNAVAFTIDDGFCGLDNSDGCMLEEVRQLFSKYDAHATFFIAGSHCQHVSIEEVNNLISDGHEIANHNIMDWSYENYTSEDFEYDLLLTKNILSNYNQNYSHWYRAPFGKLTDKLLTTTDLGCFVTLRKWRKKGSLR